MQAVPHRRGEVLLTAADGHGARLSAEGRQRRAVALVGVDDVSHPGARHVIVEDAALAAARAALHRLEDGQGIVPVRIQQARDARREVRRVLLERAGAQRLLPRAADGEAVADGVGLVAVRNDPRLSDAPHRVIEDALGIHHGRRVEGLRADAVVRPDKHAVAAVGAAAHDEIGQHAAPVVAGAAEHDAAARIGIVPQQTRNVIHSDSPPCPV